MAQRAFSPDQSLIETVHQIEPVIRQHADEAEQERQLPDSVAEAMSAYGLYRLWRPKAFGGLEVDPMTAFRVFEEVSRIDSAAGWNLQLSCGADVFGAFLPDQGAQEIFGPDAILAGSFFPPRKAVPVDGGYRVSGQSSFHSGCRHATAFIGLANIYDGDSPRLYPNGAPVGLITTCPASDATIIDTWRTMGMRGTGSHDVLMTNAFVPEHRTALLAPYEKPGSAYKGPLYKFTLWTLVSALSSVALGIARAAINELLDLASRKTPSYTVKPLRDRSTVQERIGEAEATLGAARAYLYEALQEVWEGAVLGRIIDMPGKMKLQLAATHAAISCAKVVDLVHAAAGTAGIRDEYRFNRHFRDVHTITQHAFISASRYESGGQFYLGVPIEWPFYGL
jgi:indole-3-acetate monooxygenase